eukprot:gene3969-18210_t
MLGIGVTDVGGKSRIEKEQHATPPGVRASALRRRGPPTRKGEDGVAPVRRGSGMRDGRDQPAADDRTRGDVTPYRT